MRKVKLVQLVLEVLKVKLVQEVKMEPQVLQVKMD